jgi:hypothetical protein
MRLYPVATVEGMPIMWCLANPELDEREVMQALLEVDPHLVTAGQVILADKGFAGQTFEQFLNDLACTSSAHPAPEPNATPSPPRSNAGCCACANGSRRSSTPSKANYPWNNTAPDKPTDSTPESANAC